jgi:hypothetical protein
MRGDVIRCIILFNLTDRILLIFCSCQILFFFFGLINIDILILLDLDFLGFM